MAEKTVQNYELIVFDWDGTLADSTTVIINSLCAACGDLGLPLPPRERARYVIGLGMQDSLNFIAPGLEPAQYLRLAERYRERFLAQPTALYDGSVQLLQTLADRGHGLAIATGKSTRGLERNLDELDLRKFFSAWRCADRCASKPAPDMLIELMDELDVEAARTLMIGDTTHDLQMARNAGVAALAVTHGAHDEAALRALEPLACVSSTGEMEQWLTLNG